MEFLKQHDKRKEKRKLIEHAMFQVKYARRMREDLISPEQVAELHGMQREMKAHIKSGELEEGTKLAEKGLKLAKKIHPAPNNKIALRENIEVFVVVMAVALGVRTYFLQPYQIPTGSMQPTLYGITGRGHHEPDWTDRMPAKIGKFLLTGSRYTEIRAKGDGIMPPPSQWRDANPHVLIGIGGKNHKVHRDLLEDPETGFLYPWIPRPSSPVRKGDLISKGLMKQGDHIVVNRFITNFKRPDRGDIVVFHTQGLPAVRPNSAYIKRLTGLPGESMSIGNGFLYADGVLVNEPDVFTRQYEDPRYPGYTNPNYLEYEKNGGLDPILATSEQKLVLGEEEYLMMGDNTQNSLDGRYFGAVPGKNIMGIGFFVPWPFISRGIHDDHAGVVK